MADHWVIDLTMRNKEARRYRERVIPQAMAWLAPGAG